MCHTVVVRARWAATMRGMAAPTLRERKKQRTREQLQHVALELFAERGFDQVTADEIAERAEVSRSTFFRYFRTKEEVLLGRADELLAELDQSLADRPREEPLSQSVRRALQAMAAAYEDRRVEVLAILEVASSHPDVLARALEHQAAWEASFAAQLAERMGGGGGAERRARVVAGAVMAGVRVAVEEWTDAGGRLDLLAVLDEVLDVLDAGLAATLDEVGAPA